MSSGQVGERTRIVFEPDAFRNAGGDDGPMGGVRPAPTWREDSAKANGPTRILTFTSLFPSEARPRHGIFVKTRLTHLLDDCGLDARVIAPVPWFPLSAPLFGQYAQMARTPRRSLMDGRLQVSYPRYFMLPKIGTVVQPDS